jgi:serine/threonine protein kinase
MTFTFVAITPNQSTMQPPIPVGTVLQNRYRIIQTLGQGGFGRTYLAEDERRFKELCAIKELIPTATGEVWEKAQELFQREAAVLYQIQHLQVPQFRERFEQDQRLFLVQEYVAGKTYRTLLDERKEVGSAFTEAEVLQLISSLLPVLEYIHAQGIIHRDISPENIIFRLSDKKPVLIDFGVVKELVTRFSGLGSTVQATTVGKLGYSPSEQMQTGRAYPSSDLYALAVTAIVLLTVREPSELFDQTKLIWNWQRWVTVHPQFAQVLNRMLSSIPGDRYQNATDVAIALHSINQPTAPTSNPNVSNVQTIAVGRHPVQVQQSPNRLDPVIPQPNNSSVLDNPLAIGVISSVVVILAGFSSWVVVSSLRNPQSSSPPQILTSPQTFPSPVITASATFTTPTPTPTPTPTNDVSAVFVKRLNFDASNTSNVTGTLKTNQTVKYIFSGKEGLELTVMLAQEGVLLTIFGPNGEPIDSSAKDVTFYQGKLLFNGGYSIFLSPASGVPENDYSLNVTLEKPVKTPPREPSQGTSPKIPTPDNSPSIPLTTDKSPELPTPENSPSIPLTTDKSPKLPRPDNSPEVIPQNNSPTSTPNQDG